MLDTRVNTTTDIAEVDAGDTVGGVGGDKVGLRGEEDREDSTLGSPSGVGGGGDVVVKNPPMGNDRNTTTMLREGGGDREGVREESVEVRLQRTLRSALDFLQADVVEAVHKVGDHAVAGLGPETGSTRLVNTEGSHIKGNDVRGVNMVAHGRFEAGAGG